jgi:hypothetical protein
VADIANLFHLRQRKSQAGQAQILAAALFLFLIPTTIIVAQNATDNITGYITANMTGMPPENATENTTLPCNETPDSKNSAQEVTVLIGQINQSSFLNDTNITLPEENATINTTPKLNHTPENITREQPEQEPVAMGPVLEVNISVPEIANRNEPFLLSAEISNSGETNALGVEVEWILPDGISILEGSSSHYCDVPVGATCTSELEAAASLSSALGEREIKVLVSYLE